MKLEQWLVKGRESLQRIVDSGGATDVNPFCVRLFEPEDGHGRGVTIWDQEEDEPIPWEDWFEATQGRLYSVRVVGGQEYHSAELQLHTFAPGHEVLLVPEPDNPYDSNAVAVYDRQGNFQAGYIPREEAASIQHEIRRHIRAFVVWETLAEGKRVGLRLAVTNSSFGDQFAVAMEQVQTLQGHEPAQAEAEHADRALE